MGVGERAVPHLCLLLAKLEGSRVRTVLALAFFRAEMC